ncbi:hypothetical protein GCM10027073_27290 [Streptomyces chlorus]
MRHPPRSVLLRPVIGTAVPRAGTPVAPVLTAHETAPVCTAEHSATASPRDAGTGSAVFPLDGTTRPPDAGAAHSRGTPHGRSGPRTSRTADRTLS